MPISPQGTDTLASKDHARLHRVVDMEADTPEGSLVFDSAGDAEFAGEVIAENLSGTNTGDQDISSKEDTSNKSTDVATDGASDTKYPSVKAIKDYADGLVVGLLDYRGGYDASVNTFPASGGSGAAGAVLKGDMWVISVAGTLGGVAVQVGDAVIANVDTPGQTAGNWNILNSNISYVPEDVANKKTDLTDNSDTFYPTQKAVKDAIPVKATGAEIDTGTDDAKFATPKAVADSAITTPTKTQTFTNKRITKRVTAITSHATPTINTDDCDVVDITALAEAITNMSTNLSGTPTNKQTLIFEIKDNGTARAITWGTSFVAGGVALPTTTVLSKILTVGFMYSTANSLNKWRCIASSQEA